jgi:inner membrane transporter RhtA
MLCAQLGLAASVGLLHRVGPFAVGWLRLLGAGALILVVARPRVTRLAGSDVLACVGLGVVTAGLTLFYMAALARLPLATAGSLEFLGPLSLALVAGRGHAKLWPVLAAVGVVLITRPWHGGSSPLGIVFALAAAACWAAYILLTRRVGDELFGVEGLAISLPVAALIATAVSAPAAVGRLTWPLLLAGLGLAVVLPLVPYALEMIALRRLTTVAFGTLMSLEPAMALIIGLVALHQVPGLGATAGVGFVVVAGIGAGRVDRSVA